MVHARQHHFAYETRLPLEALILCYRQSMALMQVVLFVQVVFLEHLMLFVQVMFLEHSVLLCNNPYAHYA